jgi:hypothetical protein
MVEVAGSSQVMNAETRLTPFPREEWDSCGRALLPGFLRADELADLCREADRLMRRRELFDDRGAVPFSPTRHDRLDPVIDLSPPFAALASDPRLLALATAILGDGVQPLKDKFIAKPPGASGYLTHQDGAYWAGLGIDPSRFLTIAIFLDDAPAERGPIECAPGFHRQLLTDPDNVADPDESLLGDFTVIEAGAGDALLLHSLTPHRSGPNRSNDTRRALLFSYGVDDRPGLYDRYYELKRSITV